MTSVTIDPGAPRVFHVLAAFPENSSPRLKALVFGVDWDSTRFVVQESGPCGNDPFEVKDAGWPGPGTGVEMSWPAARTALMSEVYWFAGYAYSTGDTTSFPLIPHPVQGGQFADDSEPPAVDEIAGYGRLGFGTAGLLPCREATETGSDGPEVEGDGGEPGTEEPEGSEESAGGPDGEFGPSGLLPGLDSSEITVWIDGDAIDLGTRGGKPLPIGEVPYLATRVRERLITTGAREIRKQFPGSSPADTVGTDFRGDPIGLPDLSGFYLVTYDSPAEAEFAAGVLFGTDHIGSVAVNPIGRTMLDPPDPYFNTVFPVRAFNCDSWAHSDGCRVGTQWGLVNHARGRPSFPDTCRAAVAGEDIRPPLDIWPDSSPIGYLAPTLVGHVDTGVEDGHPDLAVYPVPQELRDSIQNYPNSDWCARHGTKMAGLSSAQWHNERGIAGVCGRCQILDIEAAPATARCSADSCDAHSETACNRVYGWEDIVDQAVRHFRDDGWKVLNLALGNAGESAPKSQVLTLWRAYLQGILTTAPHGDTRAEWAPVHTSPANIPFVLSVGGFTHDGRFWDRGSTCYKDEGGQYTLRNGTGPGPGLDICAPACPEYLTTLAFGDYGWTTGQTSGSSSIVAGAVGFLRQQLDTYCGGQRSTDQPRRLAGDSAGLGYALAGGRARHGRLLAMRAVRLRLGQAQLGAGVADPEVPLLRPRGLGADRP